MDVEEVAVDLLPQIWISFCTAISFRRYGWISFRRYGWISFCRYGWHLLSAAGMDGSPSAGMDPNQPDKPFIDPRITQDAEWHAELSEYADAVRMATGGSSPTLSSAGHDGKLREIATNTDTITGLAFWSEADSNFGQYDPDCSGAVCTHHSMHPEDYVTKENLIDPKEDVVFFPLMRHRGTEINRGEGEGNDTSGEAFGEWESQANNLVLNHVVGSFTYTKNMNAVKSGWA